MTVVNTSAVTPEYTASGADQAFNYDFYTPGLGELLVLADGEVLDTGDYVVTRAEDGSGTVRPVPPLAAGTKVRVVLDPDFKQEVAFSRFGAFTPDQINPALDRAAAKSITLRERVSRALLVSVGSTALAVGLVGQNQALVRRGDKLIGVDLGEAVAQEFMERAEAAAVVADDAADVATEQAAVALAEAGEAGTARAGAVSAKTSAETAAALADTYRGLVEAMLSNGGVPYANTYATALPRGVTTGTVGGVAVTGATPGTYALTPTGGSITGVVANLVVVSATEARIDIVNPGLGSGTTAPTWAKPAGANLPAGTTITANVSPLVGDQKAYAVASATSDTILIFRNNAGAVATLNNPDGSQISFLNARELRRFIARFSTYKNTAYVATNPHWLRVRVNIVMDDGSTPPECWVYDCRRDLSTRCVVDIKRVSDNLRIGALAATTSGATVASYINPVTASGANGGIGNCVFPMAVTTEARAAGVSTASTIEVDFVDGGTWGAAQDGTNVNTLLNSDKMGLGLAERAQIASIATTTVNTASRMFDPIIPTDTYAAKIMKDIVVEGADDDDTIFMNYETIYFPGVPLYRVKLRAHSAAYGNAEVGRFDFQKSTLPNSTDIPATVQLTFMADGVHAFGNDPGITCTVDVDLASFDWTKTLTTYTTPAATKTAKGKNRSLAALRRRWLSRRVSEYRRITIGATKGQYATVVAAISAITNPNAAGTITRTTYPSTHFCSPGKPLLFEIVEAHTEEVTPYTALGLDQSPLRLPHGAILRTRRDTLIFMNHATSTAPVIEMNYTSFLDGQGTIEQRGAGYIIHVDNSNGISDASPVAPFVLRRAIQTVFGNVLLLKSKDNTVPHVGSGISNGQDIVFWGTRFKRPANTAKCDYVFVHNSPEETHPGTVTLVDVQTDIDPNDATVAFMTVSKSHASDVVHTVSITNSEVYRVKVANLVGGAAGWAKGSPMPGVTTTSGVWA